MKKANAKSQFASPKTPGKPAHANLPFQWLQLCKSSNNIFQSRVSLMRTPPQAIENKRVLSSPTPPRMQHLKIALGNFHDSFPPTLSKPWSGIWYVAPEEGSWQTWLAFYLSSTCNSKQASRVAVLTFISSLITHFPTGILLETNTAHLKRNA